MHEGDHIKIFRHVFVYIFCILSLLVSQIHLLCCPIHHYFTLRDSEVKVFLFRSVYRYISVNVVEK